ncbi:MAG: MarR family winged helix-turn-helix transcriptional regulator [Burkholderiaceae bacterium]
MSSRSRSAEAVATRREATIANYEFSEQVGHLIRRAYQRHAAIFQQLMPDQQLTSPQFAVLCCLMRQDRCSLSEIVQQTAIDQATARGVVDRLRARRLIDVVPDKEDRRRVVISLTGAGEKLVESMLPFAHDVTARTFGDFTPVEQTAFLYLLRKMLASDEIPVDSR